MNDVNRMSRTQDLIDSMFFPVRALFIPEHGMLGLSSLRDERFRLIAKHAKGRVLDIGCGRGNLFIKNYVDPRSNSVGVDVFEYEGVENVIKDLTKLPFDNESFDTVTLIAVGGHIPKDKRVKEFEEFARVLKVGGRILFTEGEPITQTINHVWRHATFSLIGKKDMDHERGMEEEEQYCMPQEEIDTYLNTKPLKMIEKKKFMWGLNNLYIAQKY